MLNQLGINSEQFHTLFGGSSLAVLLCKVTHNNEVPVDLVAVDLNPAFERLFNLKREHSIHKKFSQFPEFYNKEWLASYGQVALTGNSHIREVYFSSRNK
jgi:PAS domain-containing protein